MALTGTNIIGRIALPDDTNPVNSVVRFIMTGFDTDDTENATIIQIPIDATIDALGDINVNLWPNPLGVRSTFYATYVRIPDGNTNDVINVYVGQISVPATGGPYDLNDLLPITPPAGADVADYIAQLAAAVALAESAAGGAFAAAAEVSATNAAISEANAAISEVASGSSANAAAVSATSAELSAIAAGAAIYADTTAGLAATVSGDVFLVPDANGMIVYENDTGVAVSLGRFRPAVFDSISEMATSTGLIDGQFITVNSGFNSTPETFQYDAASTATADGALIVTATGMGVGRLISERTVYANWAELDADVRSLAADTLVETVTEGWSFKVAASGAVDQDVTTTGGMKLYRLANSFMAGDLNRSYRSLVAILRNTAGQFYVLGGADDPTSDLNHEPIGVTHIDPALTDGRLRVEHPVGGTLVGAVSVTPDETFTRHDIVAGPSMNEDRTTITFSMTLDGTINADAGTVSTPLFDTDVTFALTGGLGRLTYPATLSRTGVSLVKAGTSVRSGLDFSVDRRADNTGIDIHWRQTVEGRFSWDGVNWVLSNANTTNLSAAFASNALTITHGEADGYDFTVMAFGVAGLRASIAASSGITPTAVKVNLYDAAGALVTAPTTAMKVQFTRRGINPVTGAVADATLGNYLFRAAKANIHADKVLSGSGNWQVLGTVQTTV